MSNERTTGHIRKLWPNETDRFRDHLLRLDGESRRMRFAHGVADAFIIDYAKRMNDMGGIVYAYIENDMVRATAELRRISDTWGREFGSCICRRAQSPGSWHRFRLMGRVICSARNRGVGRLYMSCLADNRRMQTIARKYEAELKFEYGEVTGEIEPVGPDYFSFLSEAVDDRIGFMLAVLDIHERISRVA